MRLGAPRADEIKSQLLSLGEPRETPTRSPSAFQCRGCGRCRCAVGSEVARSETAHSLPMSKHPLATESGTSTDANRCVGKRFPGSAGFLRSPESSEGKPRPNSPTKARGITLLLGLMYPAGCWNWLSEVAVYHIFVCRGRWTDGCSIIEKRETL